MSTCCQVVRIYNIVTQVNMKKIWEHCCKIDLHCKYCIRFIFCSAALVLLYTVCKCVTSLFILKLIKINPIVFLWTNLSLFTFHTIHHFTYSFSHSENVLSETHSLRFFCKFVELYLHFDLIPVRTSLKKSCSLFNHEALTTQQAFDWQQCAGAGQVLCQNIFPPKIGIPAWQQFQARE